MATIQMSEVIRHLRRTVLLADRASSTDGQLLEDFISRRNEAALAALVGRHGPMVWGVCHRVLRNYHDAEDAFQATFLVLVRRATSIASRGSVGNWLYGVAHQTALKARATTAKRRARERQVTAMPEPAIVEQDLWHDVEPLLDEELSHLPDKYRAVIVLCDLEGKTRKEAARQLRCPEGTVAGRLARARRMLAKRLTQRGVALSGAALAVVLSERVASAGVPSSLMSSAIKSARLFAAGQAAGMISVKVAALTEGVLKTMFLKKLKTSTAGLLLVFAVLGGGAGLHYRTQAAEQPQAVEQKAQQATEKANKGKQTADRKDEKPKLDMERLQGAWKVASVVEDGKKEDEDVEKGTVWTFRDTTLKIRQTKGVVTEFYRFKLDETTKPKSIDMVEWDKEFDDADERKEGVYSLDGDTLKICLSLTKGDRPTALASKEGSGYFLWTLKRDRPKAGEKSDKQKQPVPKDEKPKNADDAAVAKVVASLEEKVSEIEASLKRVKECTDDATLFLKGDAAAVAKLKRLSQQIEASIKKLKGSTDADTKQLKVGDAAVAKLEMISEVEASLKKLKGSADKEERAEVEMMERAVQQMKTRVLSKAVPSPYPLTDIKGKVERK